MARRSRASSAAAGSAVWARAGRAGPIRQDEKEGRPCQSVQRCRMPDH